MRDRHFKLDHRRAPDLVGLWGPGPAGGGTLFDMSRRGNDGNKTSDVGWAVSAERKGLVQSHDGTNYKYWDVGGDSLSPGSTGKLYCAWLKPNDSNNNTMWVFKAASAVSFRLEFGGTGKPALYLSANNYRYWVAAAWTLLKDGDWHHVALWVAGEAQADINNAVCWIDGIEQGIDGTIATGVADTMDILRFGDHHAYDGLADDCRVYDRKLSTAEIQHIYQKTRAVAYSDIAMQPRRGFKAAVAPGGIAPTSHLYGPLVGPLGGAV